MAFLNKKVFLFILILVSALIAYLRTEQTNLNTDIKIISESEYVETYLQPFESVIGADYPGYRNHIYRVLTFAIHFLNGKEDDIEIIAAALVFHDIGLWTDKAISYIDVSVDRAKWTLRSILPKESIDLVNNIIYWHHKITPYTGRHEDVIEAVRKADWLDATLGIVNYGMPASHISKVYKAIPDSGFHQTFHGWNYIRIVREISQIFRL